MKDRYLPTTPPLFLLVLIGLAPALTGQATRRLDRAFDGGEPDAAVTARGIAGGGRYVLMESTASNLVRGDTNDVMDVFVHDLLRDITERVSASTAGAGGNRDSQRPTISADGRFVVFDSLARNLTTDDTNQQNDVFVRDLARGLTTRITVPVSGTVNGGSFFPRISGNGRFVGGDTAVLEATIREKVARARIR